MKSKMLPKLLLILFTLLVSFASEAGRAELLGNWQWMNPLPQDHALRVSYGNGLFVAVGESGAMYTSSDQATWTWRDSGTNHLLYDTAYGENTFAVVGANGTILTSPDGVRWTIRLSGTSYDLKGIAYGNGIFVAVGDTILTSPDGINWNEKLQATNHHFSGVDFENGIFTAVADQGTILISPDGSEWTQGVAGTRSVLLSNDYGEENFVATGERGALLLSASLLFPQISVSPTSLNFGWVTVGSSSSQNLTIRNSGSADLVIRQLTTEGVNVTDFITQNDRCTGTTLLPSGNCTVQVVFSPHAGGSKSAALSIFSNDPAKPIISVSLTGSGGPFLDDSPTGFCFIATALRGSDYEEHYLGLLRKFRNAFLLKSKPGKALVAIYYRYSPPLANFIAPHDFLRGFVRLGLVPLVAVSYVALYTSPYEKFLFFFALVSGVILLRSGRWVPGCPGWGRTEPSICRVGCRSGVRVGPSQVFEMPP